MDFWEDKMDRSDKALNEWKEERKAGRELRT